MLIVMSSSPTPPASAPTATTAAPTDRPAPIDPRGPRFNQAVLTAGLLGGFLLDARAVIPVFAVVLALGSLFGPRGGPFLRLYASVIRPRLSPPEELEDPRPPRFASTVGVIFLAGATASLLAGNAPVAWGLALVVAALAGLAAATGLCVGCEIYLWVARRRGKAIQATIPRSELARG